MRKILLGAALVVFAAGASAQDRRPDYGPAVNAAAAKKIAAGVIAECQKNSWNVAVAVVDTHGLLGVLRAHGQHADRQHGHRHRQGEGRGDLSAPDTRFHGGD